MRLKKISTVLALLILLSVVVIDSLFHFDSERVRLKEKNYSAQRNWSIHYGQQYVYQNGPFKYVSDFQKMAQQVEPGSTLISDIATSYYASTELPVYVVNVHTHHGRNRRPAWAAFLKSQLLCYIDEAPVNQKVTAYFGGLTETTYIIVNKDRLTNNRKSDCLGFRSHVLSNNLTKFANLLVTGEFLDLYMIKSGFAPSPRNK